MNKRFYRAGIMRRLEIAKRTYIDPQIMIVDEAEWKTLQQWPDAVCDLTPKYLGSVVGMFRDVVFARFWTDACPCRKPGLARLTACRMCGDSGRLVIT